MQRPLLLLLIVFLTAFSADAQKKFSRKKNYSGTTAAKTSFEASGSAIVVDERLAVLRAVPSLFARPVQRMRRGRIVTIYETREADGVVFYRIKAMPNRAGWVQKEALAGKFRRGDDVRLVRLIQASEGFEKIERARIFLDNFAASPLRPAILLLFGDLMEEAALRISREAGRRLDRREMAASGAPMHSFYLNFASLDRYRRLGVVFLFNPNSKLFHYNGAAWRQVTEKFSGSVEAVEAQKRLDLLKEKMKATN